MQSRVRSGVPWLGIPASRGVVEGNEIPYQPWARTKKTRTTRTG